MNITFEKKDTMTFIGYHTEIHPGEGYRKCPEFWNKEYAVKYARLLRTMEPQNDVERAILENRIGMYAVCDDSGKMLTYWIAGLYQGGSVPEGLELCSFPAGEWAVFTEKGPIPEALQALNTAVWRDWFPKEGQKYQADGTSMLEVYSDGDMRSPDYEFSLWVPIKGKVSGI